MAPLSYRKIDFEEFCAAAISIYQLEAVEGWEQIAYTAFEHFERDANRIISVEELARVYIYTIQFYDSNIIAHSVLVSFEFLYFLGI